MTKIHEWDMHEKFMKNAAYILQQYSAKDILDTLGETPLDPGDLLYLLAAANKSPRVDQTLSVVIEERLNGVIEVSKPLCHEMEAYPLVTGALVNLVTIGRLTIAKEMSFGLVRQAVDTEAATDFFVMTCYAATVGRERFCSNQFIQNACRASISLKRFGSAENFMASMITQARAGLTRAGSPSQVKPAHHQCPARA